MHNQHMVGRESEVALLDSALDSVGAGPVACVLCGEAGMGRSTLWSAAAASAQRRGYQVLSCRPGEPEQALSFAGLVDLFDPVADRVADLPAPQAYALGVALLRTVPGSSPPDQRAVCLATLGLVRLLAASRPLVLAVDDSQWLDQATAAVLAYLVRRLSVEPVALLVTVCCHDHRDEAVPLDLDRSLPDDRVHRIRLRPLTAPDLRRLVRRRTGLTLRTPQLQRLEQACSGNPLLALEIAQSLDMSGVPAAGDPLPVPQTLAEAVAARVAALPAPTREVLLYAAASHQPTAAQLRAATGTAGSVTPGLAAAEEAGIIEVNDGRIRFTQPGYASAVYARAGSERRRAAHSRLADVAGEPEQRARHLALAVDVPDAAVADILEEAARHAHARGAPVTAAELWDLASRRTPPAQPAARQRRAVASAQCLFSAGDATRARAILEAAAAAMPDGQDKAQALLWLASVLFYDGSPRDAVDALHRALMYTDGDPLLTGTIQLRIAWFADFDLGLRLNSAQAARALLDSADVAPELRGGALLATTYFGFLAGRGIDEDGMRAGAALLPSRDFSWDVEFGRTWLNMLAKHLDLHAARAGWLAKYQRAREIGDEPAVPHALFHLAEIECWLGDWALAQRYATEMTDTVDQTGQRRWVGLARYVVALVAAHRGDAETVLDATGEGLRLADELSDPMSAALHRSVLGFLELSRGDAASADRHLAVAADLVTQMGLREPARYMFYPDQIEAALALADTDRAGALLADLQRRAEISPYPWLLAVTARCRAQHALATGDLDAAAAAIETALRAHANLPMPMELARTLLVHGRVLRRRKDKRNAEQALRLAAQTFTRLGAPLWTGQAQAELHRLGLRRVGPDQLTATEAQVARLVVEGRANDEVAAVLFISHRTVENHLSRIYRKLGVRSRTELARRWPALSIPG